MRESVSTERYNATLDALAEAGAEATDERKAHREFKLALLAALGVTDPWAITTWRQAEYCAAIQRLRAATPGDPDA